MSHARFDSISSAAKPLAAPALAMAWILAASGTGLAAEGGPASSQHWYRGNTHTHTHFSAASDANASPAEVVSWFKDHGYQFVVITDHENLTDVVPLNQKYAAPDKFLIIPGQEITQVIADSEHVDGVRHAHMNGINTNRVIMPIRPAPDSKVTGILSIAARGVSMTQTYQKNMAEILAAGGLPQINHPNLLWSVELKDLLPLDSPYLFEVWNGYPASNNLGGRDGEGHDSPSSEALWDELLSRGKTVWAVGSDDSHAYHSFDDPETPHPGRAWVEVCAPELSATAITNALKQGRFYASTGVRLQHYGVDSQGISIDIQQLPDWSSNLTTVTRYITRFVGQYGKLLNEVRGTSPHYAFRGTESYVRASIIDSDGRRAWTQPVFRDSRKTADADSQHCDALRTSMRPAGSH
jgi:hypothetical protein